MPSYEEMMANLDPKVAKGIKLAQDIELELLPLASVGLTNALGGGIGKGRYTLLYGGFAATKSALMMESVGRWQKQGLSAVWVDVERALNKEWAATLGVDTSALPVITSKSSAKIEEELKPFLLAGVDVIVIDSISDILPAVFTEGEDLKDDRKQIGAHAKAIVNLLNGISYLNDNTAVVLISQTTTDLGGKGQHKPQIPHGGKKVKFSSSQIIKLTSSAAETQQIKGEALEGQAVVQASIGRSVEYLVEKNRMGRPFIAGDYNFYYAGDQIGIDRIDEVLSVAIRFGIVEANRAWFTCTLTGVQYNGKKKLVAALKSDPKYWDQMQAAVEEILSAREPVEHDEEGEDGL